MWDDLGKPTISDALLSGGLLWSLRLSGKRSYVGWLWLGGYNDLRDAEAAAIGGRLRRLRRVALAIVVLWAASVWLGGYAYIR